MQQTPDEAKSDRWEISAYCGKIMGELPTPHRHLNAMFGIAITAAVLMMISLPIYFEGHIDVDRQSPKSSQYSVDINCPRWAEFANLPMIGEKTAQAIVNHGREMGGFDSIYQLLDVKGVGAKTLAKVKPFLTKSNRNVDSEQPKLPNTLLSAD